MASNCILRGVILAGMTVLAAAAVTEPKLHGQAPAAGKASGNVTIDGRSMRVAHVYAWSEPNRADSKKTDVLVLVTQREAAPEAFAGAAGMIEVCGRIHGFILFVVDERGSVSSEIVDHPALDGMRMQNSGVTPSSFTARSFSTERVEGTYQTKGTLNAQGHEYRVEVEVDAAVIPAPRSVAETAASEPLPSGGGEPGKAYLALHSAVAKKDLAAILNLTRKSGRTAAEEPSIERNLDAMAQFQPTDPKIIDGLVSGDAAVLHVEGIEDGQKRYGRIEMVREGGVWRFVKQQWSDTPVKLLY
ncbi:MAG: hypothetical protein EHM13_01525 [Acidobacteria bacterium]|nr:MAG: hypothetical protein EHM13_01525 [Acidobacteriota bacterium]